MKAFQPLGYGRYAVTKSDGNQRCCPAAFMIVSRERRPASVRVLRVEKKTLSTFSDVCGLGPECKQRIACRLQCRLRRRCECGPTSARKLSTSKFGAQVVENHK
jgi:hypothetical protein